MPYINRRTGQVIQGPQQQASQQASGGFNPLSSIRQGLNLGGNFLSGTAGNLLGSINNGLGLVSGFSGGNPLSVAQSGLGMVGNLSRMGAFNPSTTSFLTGTPGAAFLAPSQGISNLGGLVGAGTNSGFLGAAGPVGAVIGGGLAFGGLMEKLFGEPKAQKGILGFGSGPSMKDVKRDVAFLQQGRQAVNTALQAGVPVKVEDLDMGSFVGQKNYDFKGKPMGGWDAEPKQVAGNQVAWLLNHGFDIQPQDGRYVVPVMLDPLAFEKKGADPMFGARPSGKPQQFMVSVPVSELAQNQKTGTWTTRSDIADNKQTQSDKRNDRRDRLGIGTGYRD